VTAGPASRQPLPEEAFAVALARLPAMGWRRMGALIAGRSGQEAWEVVKAGRVLEVVPPIGPASPSRVLDRASDSWRARACGLDVAASWSRTCALGITVRARGRAGYPEVLDEDPEPPAVVFHLGAVPSPGHRRVAVVGTRHCSYEGREAARSIGYGLAEAGVTVVSGLALGIDGAAHQGALAAGADGEGVGPPFGVVASGLDVPYPARHAGLWRQVAVAGGLLSEYPPGSPATRMRFPARNRLIAAFAEIVVVVESRVAGGSRHTVEAAIARGRTVMAVPGSIRNPAAAGTNRLIAEGCAPVCDVADILVALDLERAGRPEPAPRPDRRAGAAAQPGRRPVSTSGPAGITGEGVGAPSPARRTRPDLSRAEQLVLDAVGGTPASLDTLLLRTGAGPLALTAALERLRAAELVVEDAGWWSLRPR